MKTKAILVFLFACLAAVIVGSIVSLRLSLREPQQQKDRVAADSNRPFDADRARSPNRLPASGAPVRSAQETPVLEPRPADENPIRLSTLNQSHSTTAEARAAAIVSSVDSHPDMNDPAVKQQIGRVALSYVGSDPDAEDLWLWAINDPNLPAKTRQDLIEDLNEDGFPDPKNVTVDDLPLIESRILLIEDVVGDAMDEVNYNAFLEAYKDLVNMWFKLTQQPAL